MRVYLAIALAVTASMQNPAPGPRLAMLPPIGVRAAEAGALEFAFVAAQLGVPVGVVTSRNPNSPVFAEWVVRGTEPRPVPIGEAVDRFARAHPDYAVSWRGDLLGIEQRGLACAEDARTRSIGAVTVDGDMSRLIVLLGWLAGGRAGPVPSGMVSAATPTNVEPRALPSVHIAGDRDRSLRDGLDEVVKQSRGGAWIVWEHPRMDGPAGCRTAGYFPNGYLGASSVDFVIR